MNFQRARAGQLVDTAVGCWPGHHRRRRNKTERQLDRGLVCYLSQQQQKQQE